MAEIGREFRSQADLEIGTVQPFDEVFAAYSPSAHVADDWFANKLAFVALLNFPLTTLDQRVQEGPKWSRRQWAETRLAHRFSKRIPAEVNQEISQAASVGEAYISGYNIWMHHVIDDKGQRLFPAKMRLLSHWNLRDQIKADYSDAAQGLAKQRAMQQVMERIVTQTIPETVIDNPHVDWNPFTNEVKAAAVQDADGPAPVGMKISNNPEPDTRYKRLWDNYAAEKKADPYSPTAPTLIARRFDENREIPEARVREMLVQVLKSPLVPRTAALIESRLGRKLEPFDIWYNGFKDRGKYSEAELDAITRKKYPTPEAFATDIPNILTKLGFAPEKARYVAGNIVVDPARGSGHALGAAMRSAKAHLRTRVGKDGMDYKGYNIAVHELGHNVEQTFSLNEIDHTLLYGVPNNAFTEALAFVFRVTIWSSWAGVAERAERSVEDAERLLGHLRDQRRGARRHGRLALDVRPPEGDTGRAQGGDAADLERHLEPVLRAGLQQEGRRVARDLLAHDLVLDVPAGLPDRASDRAPDRRADEEGGRDRAGVRAHDEGRQHRPGRVDAQRHRRPGRVRGDARGR
jgi:hypothetical protein